jgi:hypothetical protein
MRKPLWAWAGLGTARRAPGPSVAPTLLFAGGPPGRSTSPHILHQPHPALTPPTHSLGEPTGSVAPRRRRAAGKRAAARGRLSSAPQPWPPAQLSPAPLSLSLSLSHSRHEPLPGSSRLASAGPERKGRRMLSAPVQRPVLTAFARACPGTNRTAPQRQRPARARQAGGPRRGAGCWGPMRCSARAPKQQRSSARPAAAAPPQASTPAARQARSPTCSTRGISRDSTGACAAASKMMPPTPSTMSTLFSGSLGRPSGPMVQPAPLLPSLEVSITWAGAGPAGAGAAWAGGPSWQASSTAQAPAAPLQRLLPGAAAGAAPRAALGAQRAP